VRLGVVALVCAAAFATAAHALPDDAAVKALLHQRIAQKRAVGLAAVLFENGTTRIVTAGVARADGPAIAADTEFEIGSVTKTFTALLLADAVVGGRVRLDDPVTRYVDAPGLARDGKAVTLGQLATHSSGLPRLPRNLAPANPADPYADYDAAKLMAFLAGDVLQRTPGSAYEYSNLGAGLLGYALTMRGLMVNTIGEDYMLLADAKGLRKSRILWWYSVRNAIPPQLTHLAIALGYVVSGAILVEIVFSYPGLGYQLYQAIVNSDYTVIQGITLVLAVSVGLCVLILDLIYPRLDPRVTYVAENSG